MKQILKRLFSFAMAVLMVLSLVPFNGLEVYAAETGAAVANVAKVGNTEYATIDEAIANWANGSTLTLLANVTLSDVVTLKSTEHHILNLSTFTMTAAKNKDAIQIENCARANASYTLDIKADATNPGGITATGKAVVRTAGKSGVKDRPIIRFYGGVFNATNIVYHSGSNGTNCPQFQFHGGEFNGTIFTNRALNQFYGGTFKGSLQMSVDSSAYTLIAGGTFKQLSNLYMSTLNSDKFTIGSAKGTYNREVYVNDEGYYVVASAEPSEGFEAAVAKTPSTNDYLKYSKVGTEKVLKYTDAKLALENNKTATVTIYADEIDLAGSSFKGTIVAPEGRSLTITNAPEGLMTEGDVKIVKPAAKIGDRTFNTLQAAIDAATAGQTITLLADIKENITINRALTIAGADKTYTGKMTAKADVTVKNVNFDGKGMNDYAFETRGASYVTIEDCTAKNYGYGFIQLASATVSTTVKNVKVTGVAYGVKIDYSNKVTLEKVDITASTAGILNSNYGEKTITINNSNINILGTWTRNNTTKTNIVFEGANEIEEFIIDEAIDVFKLAAGATLTAPNGITVITDVADHEVAFKDGVYSVVETKNYVAMIGDTKFETFDAAYKAAKTGDTINLLETIVIDNSKPWVNYSTKNITVKAEFGDAAFRVVGNAYVWFGGMTIESNDYCIIVGASDSSSGATVEIYGGTYKGATTAISVTKGSVKIMDGTFSVEPYNGSYEYTINCVDAAYKNGTADVSIQGGKFYNFNPKNNAAEGNGTDFLVARRAVVKGDDGYWTVVDAVASIGNEYYATLQAAIDAAQAGDTIKLIKKVTLTEGVTVAADKTITLDLDGKTISMETADDAEYYLFYNKGDLTITDSGENGKLSYLYTGTNSGDAYNTIESAPGSVLTVQGGTIENLSSNCLIAYAIDGLTNGSAGDVTVSIEGGKITSKKIAVRIFANSTTKTGTLNISGGEISGRVIIQNANKNANKAVLNITGGTFNTNGYKTDVLYVGGSDGATSDIAASVSGGTFNGEILSSIGKGFITGGTFGNPVAEEFCAKGYIPVDNGDGTYAVVQGYDYGTWGGIDWKLYKDGTLVIAPTKGTPVADKNCGKTYEVGAWREAVRYDSNGNGVAIEGWPYDRAKVKKLIIEEGVTSIGSFAAQGFTNLTGEVVIPSTVTYIGQEAFQKSTFTKLTFAAGGTEELCIAQGAFKNLIIEEVSLPADRSVHLHAWVFNNCHNLKHATLPATLVSVHGTNHIDYFKDHNAHSNPTWTKSSEIFAYDENLETITFGSEAVRDMFFANNNGTSKDYLVAYNGLTAYCDLQAAIDAAQNGDTVKLIKNVTLPETVEIPAGKTVILDLNGKTLTGSILAPDAELTVQNGTIVNKDKGVSGIEINAGKLTLTDVNVDSARHALRIDGAVEATINGGTYRGAIGTGTGTYHAVNISGAANVTIKAGTFVGPKGTTADSGSAVNAKAEATVTIEGGNFSGGKRNTLSASGTIAVSGGTFDQLVPEDYCADGYIPVDNGDGTYGVERGLLGSGTEEDPFRIKTLDDLILFRDSVNAGKTKYNAPGVYVALTADIDLSSVDNWVPIGTFDYSFDGNFNGNGKVIKNLKMSDNTAASGYAYLGFFGVTANNVVENFVIENVTISSKGQIVAAAIAYPYYTTVRDIMVCGDIAIEGGNYTAGVLAYTRLCENASNLTVSGNAGSYIIGAKTVGGVIADIQMNNGLTANYSNFCVSGVTITGEMHVGGVAGIIAAQTLNGCTVENVTLVCDDARVGVVAGSLGAASTISDVTVANVTGATAIVGADYSTGAVVEAKVRDTYYKTFAAAYAAAKEGDTVTLLAPVVVNAGETLTLDKDVTITYTSDVVGEDMITVRGTLNVAAGKITYTNNSNGSNVTVSTISAEAGSVVNVTGGTIENKSVAPSGSSSYAYAIDMLTNGSLGDVTVTISGGTVYSDYMAIRQFNNGDACKNTLSVTGGNIYGARRAVQIHFKNNAAYTTITGGKIEGGDYALCFLTDSENLTVSGGEFIGSVWYSGTDGFISGGTFDEAVAEGYCADGYICVDNGDGSYSVKQGQYVAEVNGKKYETLTKAVNAAAAGQTITLLADVTEDVTVNKNLTIDGADKNYTGKMTLNKVNVTIENVNFVKGTVYKNKSTGAGGNYTIKDCTFDGQGLSDYAINLGGTNNIVIENVTAKDYGYGLLQVPSSNVSLTVKNVEVSGCNYGFKVDYSNGVTMENVTISDTTIGIYDSNYGAKTYTIKNCKLNAQTPIKIWERSAAKTDTFKFVGLNEVPALPTSQYAKVVAEAQVGNFIGDFAAVINAAKDGETVKLLSDFTLTDDDIQMVGSYKVMANVEGKDITLDMNGKKITVDYTGGAHLIAAIRVADGAGLTVTGNGTIDVPTNGINVAYMFWKAGTTGHMTIENGTYHMDNSADSMVYTNGDEIVTVKGGNWAIDQIGTRENGFPCIFNAQGSGDRSIIVTGGTYNDDINHQHWGNEAVVDKTCYVVDNGDGTWTVKPGAVAYVDLGTLTGPYFVAKDFGFATLEEAFAAAGNGNTITLLTDIELTTGVTVPADKTITLDLNGKTITGKPAEAKAFSVITNKGNLTITGDGSVVCDHQLAGSTGYAVNTITNGGTLIVDGAVIENKSTATNQIGYAIDNNSGNGDAVVVIKKGQVKASGSNYYDGIRLFCNSLTNENAVTVEGGAVSSIWLQNPSDGATDKDTKDVKGSVSITGGTVSALYLEPSEAFEAEITDGYVGKVEYFTTSEGRDLTRFITGGTFGMDVTAYCALGYQAFANTDGTYTVRYNENIVAWNMQTGVQYETVAGALLAAGEDETVQMIKDSDESRTVVTVLNGITLDLNGHTLTAYYAMTATVGSYIIDSTNGQGLLKVAKNNLVMAANTQLKIWKEEEQGYRFATATFGTYLETSTAGATTFWFWMNEPTGLVMKELADGAADKDGLSMRIRMSYINSQGGTSVLYFDFPAEMVQQYGQLEVSGTPSSMTMTISKLDTVSEVSFTAMVTSDSVAVESETVNYNG